MKEEYPKWVYKGKDSKIVETKEDHAKAKRAGWKETPKGK